MAPLLLLSIAVVAAGGDGLVHPGGIGSSNEMIALGLAQQAADVEARGPRCEPHHLKINLLARNGALARDRQELL